MEKRNRKYLLTIALAGTALITALIFMSSFRIKSGFPETESLASDTYPEDSEKSSQLDVVSPDTKYTLSMKTVIKPDGSMTQSFTVTSEKDQTPVKILERETTSGSPILIPYNTFSPDNKYIFLKAGKSDAPEYLILKTDGENIKAEQKTVEIVSSFAEKYPDFVITDVTGWGGNNLIVVNTDEKDGKVGPSWWFDLSNFGFIRLSQRFN